MVSHVLGDFHETFNAHRTVLSGPLPADVSYAGAYGQGRFFAAELAAARTAFAADAGYAAAMARAAVEVAQRQHAASLRATLSGAVRQAQLACEARRGQFSCAETAACGTGGCRFAAGVLADLQVTAGPGRCPRPANHVAREGFAAGPAAVALAAAQPFVVAVHLRAGDSAHAADRPAR